MTLSRRNFLRLGAATAAAAAVPFPLPSAPAEALVNLAKGPDLLAFIVGTPGEFDWQVVFADTAENAFYQRFCDWDEMDGDPYGFDEECVARVPSWDDRDPDTITNVDWVRAGFNSYCSRCGDEPMESRVISDEVVCECCMSDIDYLKALDRDDAVEHLANRLDDQLHPVDADALAFAREHGLLAEAEALQREWAAS